jgi:hypothetical protein
MPSATRFNAQLTRWLIASALFCACQFEAQAAPYELRVYSDDIPAANESDIEWLASIARPQAGNHRPQGYVTQTLVEYGYGLGKGWSVGFELPMSHADGHTQLNGLKAEVQYVAEHEMGQGLYWGVRSDVGYTSSPYEAQGLHSMDINPIVGYRWSRWHVILNPSVEIPLSGSNSKTQFQPSFKVAHNIASNRQWGVEYFGSWWNLSSVHPPWQRDETLYAVWDEQRPHARWSFGLGQPLRSANENVDRWVVKIGASIDID